MSGFIILIKQLVILIAGLALFWFVGSLFVKSLNAPVWFIAVLCCVIGGLTTCAILRVGRKK